MRLAAVPIRPLFFGYAPLTGHIGNSPGDLISTLLPNIIIIAGVIFLFLIVGAGFSMIIGAGSQKSPQEAAKAKAALTWGIIGFLLVISAYFILQAVQYMLGVDLLSPRHF
jgi:hypothetical protein